MDWITGRDPSTHFDLVLRGNHEQMMLEALREGPGGGPWTWGDNAWSLWMMNGGDWWTPKEPRHGAASWIEVLCALPFCATVETRDGPVGLVHACPVWPSWEALRGNIVGNQPQCHTTRARALWSRVRHGLVQGVLGESGSEHMAPVSGVRCVVTEHTPVPEPVSHENVLGIDTGVHIDEHGYGHLTIARINGGEIETLSFAR